MATSRIEDVQRVSSSPTLVGALIPLLLAIVSGVIPARMQASCVGLSEEDYGRCEEAESKMIQRYHEAEAAAKKRVLFVETGDDRRKTTEFDLLYSDANECRFVKKEGRFRIVDESGKTFSEGGCRCCTHLDQEGQEYVPRTRAWELHGRYLLINAIRNDPSLPAIIENDYWCGVETRWLNDLHRKSIVEACDLPLVP